MPTEPGAYGSGAATVTAQGEAVVRAEPDEATLSIVVIALGSTPNAALVDVARRSAALAALLDELAIPKEDQMTIGVTVREEIEHTPSGRRSLGHQAAAGVSIRLGDAALIARLIAQATERAQARISGLHWQINPTNPARLLAARQAAANAKRKAHAYAEGVDALLGPILCIAEPSAEFPKPLRTRSHTIAMAAGGGEPELPIEPGDHDVAAAVQITFALEQQ